MDSSARTSRREAIERELGELQNVKQLIAGELFQKYIALPVEAEYAKLKVAFDCESMYELKYTHGKRDGLKFVKSLSDEIDSKILFAKHDLETL